MAGSLVLLEGIAASIFKPATLLPPTVLSFVRHILLAPSSDCEAELQLGVQAIWCCWRAWTPPSSERPMLTAAASAPKRAQHENAQTQN